MQDFYFSVGYNRISIFYVIKDFLKDATDQYTLQAFAETATLLNEDVADFMDNLTYKIDKLFPIDSVFSSINPSKEYLTLTNLDLNFDFDIILDVDEDLIDFDSVVTKIDANKSMLVYGGIDKTSARVQSKFYTKKDLKNRILKILNMDFDYLEEKAREIFKTISQMDYTHEFEKALWKYANNKNLIADLIDYGKQWDETKDALAIDKFDDLISSLLGVVDKFVKTENLKYSSILKEAYNYTRPLNYAQVISDIRANINDDKELEEIISEISNLSWQEGIYQAQED